MFFFKVKMMVLTAAACVAIAVNFSVLFAAETNLNAENFGQLREQIRPQPGESRWMNIPWLIDIHEARQQAAAQGKPLFVYSGGGATGIGAC